MSRRKPNQKAEQAKFVRDQKAAIEKVRGVIIAAATRFFAAVKVALPAPTLQTANAAIAAGDVIGLHNAIRPQAHVYVDAGKSDHYWDLIFACQWFGDAIGTYWPYMSQSDRAKYLSWAIQDAEQIEDASAMACPVT